MPAYKDEKRGTWYAKFRAKDWMNQTRYITKRGFKNKRDALKWEREFREYREGGTNMSFEQFVQHYLEDRAPRLKDSTLDGKRSTILNKLVPYFGKKGMQDISAADVIHWQNEVMKSCCPETGKPYSKSYMRGLHVQLSAIFNHAIKFYGLRQNPARIAGNIEEGYAEEMKFWTLEEYKKFAQGLEEGSLARICFEILYWCGLRKGELQALTMADFDLAAGTVSINKTYHRRKKKDVITEPKTPMSVRTIVMPAFLVEEIREYMAAHGKIKKNARLFPVSSSFLYTNMKRVSKQQGVEKIRIHDLRHSHVSLLINMGFSAVAIAKRMGHKSINITYRYAHMFPTVQMEMADKLGEMNQLAAG